MAEANDGGLQKFIDDLGKTSTDGNENLLVVVRLLEAEKQKNEDLQAEVRKLNEKLEAEKGEDLEEVDKILERINNGYWQLLSKYSLQTILFHYRALVSSLEEKVSRLEELLKYRDREKES